VGEEPLLRLFSPLTAKNEEVSGAYMGGGFWGCGRSCDLFARPPPAPPSSGRGPVSAGYGDG